jgi:hypothetical protein
LVAATNAGRSSSSGFPNCPRPQLLRFSLLTTAAFNLLNQTLSELLYYRRFTTNQIVLASDPLRPTTRVFFSKLNTCRHSPCVTSSLTREWFFHLQLRPALASTVILRSESRGTHDHILLSQIRDYLNLEGQVSVFISLENRVALLYPRHWVPFSSLPMTRRATVKVFDPASLCQVKVTLRLTVSQSVLVSSPI